MIARLFLAIGLLCTTYLAGHGQADSLQLQINQEVWKPFIEHFNSFNTDGFMAIHSKQMSRVIQDTRTVYGYERYAEQQRRGDDNAKKKNQKRTLELRFTERIAADGRAFEVGYYKSISFMPDGKVYTGYGKFHVLLTKEDGRWKILMDADTGANVNEQVFLSATPLQ